MINANINTSPYGYKKSSSTPDLQVRCDLTSHKMLTHTSASISKFLKVKKVKELQYWSVQSPDTNIIEHAWAKDWRVVLEDEQRILMNSGSPGTLLSLLFQGTSSTSLSFESLLRQMDAVVLAYHPPRALRSKDSGFFFILSSLENIESKGGVLSFWLPYFKIVSWSGCKVWHGMLCLFLGGFCACLFVCFLFRAYLRS